MIKPTPSRSRLIAWAALAACAATLAALSIKSLLAPLPPGLDYSKVFAPPWAAATAATLGTASVLLAVAWPRTRVASRRLVLAAGWSACVLLVWSAAGILFDVLRAAALIGVPGLPPIVDWPGFATRVAGLTAAALLAAATASFQGAFRAGHSGLGDKPVGRSRRGAWFGYAALVLGFPYPLLKMYWALGGTIAWTDGWDRHAAAGETMLLIGTTALSLALVRPWGRVFPRWIPFLAGKQTPRWIPICAGWAACVVLVTMGALVVFGTIAQALGLVDGPIRLNGSAWVVYFVYIGWLLLGLAMGAATWVYQQQTRPRLRESQ